MRRLARALVLAVLAAACSSGTAQSTTTTLAIEEPPSTTTTTVAQTTTTMAEPVNICPRGTVWNPGTVYTAAGCFLVPVSFAPIDEGWRSRRASLDVVWGIWVEQDSAPSAAQFIVLAYQTDSDPSSILDSITAIEGVNATSASAGVEVAGVSGTVVDLSTDPMEEFTDPAGLPEPCSTPGDAVSPGGEPGYPLVFLNVAPGAWGFGACRPFRVWVLDVGGTAVTVVWTPSDPDRFDELLPAFERLLDSMTFERP